MENGKLIRTEISKSGMYKKETYKTDTYCLINVKCGYCNRTYHAHNSTFRNHLKSQKHKDNVYLHHSIEAYNKQMEIDQELEHDKHDKLMDYSDEE
jgi:hypothetical protein